VLSVAGAVLPAAEVAAGRVVAVAEVAEPLMVSAEVGRAWVPLTNVVDVRVRFHPSPEPVASIGVMVAA
jgi:hypothetical protein